MHARTCITSTINNSTQNINLQCVSWSLHGWTIRSKSPDYYKESVEANNIHLPLLSCSWWGLKFLDPLIVMALLLILLPLHRIICISCDLHHMIHTIRSCDPQSCSMTQMHIISLVFYTIGHPKWEYSFPSSPSLVGQQRVDYARLSSAYIMSDHPHWWSLYCHYFFNYVKTVIISCLATRNIFSVLQSYYP